MARRLRLATTSRDAHRDRVLPADPHVAATTARHPYHVPEGYSTPGHPGEAYPAMPDYPVVHPGDWGEDWPSYPGILDDWPPNYGDDED